MSGKVCYNNLIKLLIDKGLKKSELARMCNLRIVHSMILLK